MKPLITCIIFFLGWILLLSIPQHEHVSGEVEYPAFKKIDHTICLVDSTVVVDGRHVKTKIGRVIVERPEL